MDNLLGKLKDIHLPPAPSWWPPALGWWILLAIIVMTIALGVWFYRQRLARIQSPQHLALKELEDLEQQYRNNKDTKKLVINLSALIRRVAISLHPRKEVASLTDEQWLTWLDQNTSDKKFVQKTARILIEAPYQHLPVVDNPQEMIQACKTWIEQINEKEVNNDA